MKPKKAMTIKMDMNLLKIKKQIIIIQSRKRIKKIIMI